MPQITLTVTDGLLSISKFAYIAGSFSFQIGQNATVQLSGGDPSLTKNVGEITVGASDANIFVGVGGPYFQDSNGDGKIDSQDTLAADGARGFVVSDASFGLALFTPTDLTDSSLYYALDATGSVQAIGLPGDITVQANNFNIEVNNSVNDSGHVVDFDASFPTDPTTMTPAGLAVPTGGAPIVLDYEDRLLEVDTDASLSVRGQTLQGHFDFTDSAAGLSFSASNVGLTLVAGSTTILGHSPAAPAPSRLVAAALSAKSRSTWFTVRNSANR